MFCLQFDPRCAEIQLPVARGRWKYDASKSKVSG